MAKNKGYARDTDSFKSRKNLEERAERKSSKHRNHRFFDIDVSDEVDVLDEDSFDFNEDIGSS